MPTGFAEGILEEAQSTAAARYIAVDLATLVERMSKDLGIVGGKPRFGAEEAVRRLDFERFYPTCGCVIWAEAAVSLHGKQE